MPIYAYKCESCGHAKDVLQKLSDAPLTVCPDCGAETFKKQVTAAGFQLKGSGWYATDFRGGATAPAEPTADGQTEAKGDGKGDSKGDGKTEGQSDGKNAAKTETGAPAQALPADGSSSSKSAPAAPPAAASGAPTPSSGH